MIYGVEWINDELTDIAKFQNRQRGEAERWKAGHERRGGGYCVRPGERRLYRTPRCWRPGKTASRSELLTLIRSVSDLLDLSDVPPDQHRERMD